MRSTIYDRWSSQEDDELFLLAENNRKFEHDQKLLLQISREFRQAQTILFGKSVTGSLDVQKIISHAAEYEKKLILDHIRNNLTLVEIELTSQSFKMEMEENIQLKILDLGPPGGGYDSFRPRLDVCFQYFFTHKNTAPEGGGSDSDLEQIKGAFEKYCGKSILGIMSIRDGESRLQVTINPSNKKALARLTSFPNNMRAFGSQTSAPRRTSTLPSPKGNTGIKIMGEEIAINFREAYRASIELTQEIQFPSLREEAEKFYSSEAFCTTMEAAVKEKVRHILEGIGVVVAYVEKEHEGRGYGLKKIAFNYHIDVDPASFEPSFRVDFSFDNSSQMRKAFEKFLGESICRGAGVEDTTAEDRVKISLTTEDAWAKLTSFVDYIQKFKDNRNKLKNYIQSQLKNQSSFEIDLDTGLFSSINGAHLCCQTEPDVMEHLLFLRKCKAIELITRLTDSGRKSEQIIRITDECKFSSLINPDNWALAPKNRGPHRRFCHHDPSPLPLKFTLTLSDEGQDDGLSNSHEKVTGASRSDTDKSLEDDYSSLHDNQRLARGGAYSSPSDASTAKAPEHELVPLPVDPIERMNEAYGKIRERRDMKEVLDIYKDLVYSQEKEGHPKLDGDSEHNYRSVMPKDRIQRGSVRPPAWLLEFVAVRQRHLAAMDNCSDESFAAERWLTFQKAVNGIYREHQAEIESFLNEKDTTSVAMPRGRLK